MNKRAKLKDIAETLGVSITTVSRAINNKADINPQTKRKILELANQMDYRPNSLAISLRKNQTTNVVGVILPTVNHYFFSTVLNGIMSKAHLHNHLVLVGESLNSLEKEKQILDEFIEFGVRGILLAPCNASNFESNIVPILHKRVPVVIMDRSYENYHGNYVLTNDRNGARQAVEHLIDSGYKRIAHIGSMDRRSVGMDRQLGYKDALEDAGVVVDPSLTVLKDISIVGLSIEMGYAAARELFKLPNPPDAIFAVTDDVAVGVYEFAKDNGLNIPNDLGVVGFSNSKISKYVEPGLSTVEQNARAMGELTFDYFYQALISNGEVFQRTFDLQLIIRGSSVRTNK